MAGSRSGVRELVYNQLKEEIITLKLEPGTMVSENELAARLGVSRMPIHDALMALSQIHLVDVYPQRGSQISLIDLKWVDEAKFIRQTLESAVTLELFDSITEDQLTQLEVSVQKQLLYMERGCLEDFLREDDLFHQMLYLFAGRAESCRIVNDIMTHFNRIRTMTLNAHPQQPLVQEHQMWLRAIREKDTALAVRVIEQHLGKYRENMGAIQAQYAPYFK